MSRLRPNVRHELKYIINYGEYVHLSRTLDHVLARDPAGDSNNEYAVRSLYFDTIFNDFLYEKISGANTRDKYRLRIYNFSDQKIRLERKSKFGDLIAKDSLEIPRDLADQLVAGDVTGLETTAAPLLHDFFRESKTRLLRPVVLVDYIREAYVHPAEDVRVTFDKHLHTGNRSLAFFDIHTPTLPAMDNGEVVLEVKFNRVLPDYIQRLLSAAVAERMAVSKYVICRRFEGLEY